MHTGNPAPPGRSSYRAEIDGLRALSVVGVLLYHLEIAPFSGGYVGVDVFFVISGYLITRIIVVDLDAGRLSLLHFYSRRIRRLFPALFATVVATFIAAMLWFPPDALRRTGLDAATTLASVSNIQFWLQANQYFAPNFTTIPLIHTWSLGVEDQFYLIWPAALLLARKFRPWAVPAVIAIATAASLVFCQVSLKNDPAAAFYLMPFRIFELGIGGLCVWAERRQPGGRLWSEFAFVSGLLAIVASMIVFDSKTPFPGLNALLPSLGAALIIHAGQRSATSVLLNNRFAVGIGLISYSLYLCHWPFIVFARYIAGDLGGFAKPLLAVLSFACAVAMYFFIEQPFRRRSEPATPGNFARLVAYCAVCAALVVVPAALAVVQRGWEWRLDAAQRETLRLQRFGSAPCVANGSCAFGDPGGAVGLQIVGDSHAQHWVAAFDPLLRAQGLKGESYTTGGCPTLAGLDVLVGGAPSARCARERDRAFAQMKQGTAPLLVSMAWNEYRGRLTDGRNAPTAPAEYRRMVRDALAQTLKDLGVERRPVLLVGVQIDNGCPLDPHRVQPGPLWHAPPPGCKPLDLGKAHEQADGIDSMLLEFQQAFPRSVTVLRPVDTLCEADCPVRRDGLWLTQDGVHMTVVGAQYAASRAQAVLSKFMQAGGNGR